MLVRLACPHHDRHHQPCFGTYHPINITDVWLTADLDEIQYKCPDTGLPVSMEINDSGRAWLVLYGAPIAVTVPDTIEGVTTL